MTLSGINTGRNTVPVSSQSGGIQGVHASVEEVLNGSWGR